MNADVHGWESSKGFDAHFGGVGILFVGAPAEANDAKKAARGTAKYPLLQTNS